MPENKKKTRGNLAVMGRLVGLVKPLAPVMVAAVLLGCPPEAVTGRGAGLSNAGLARKLAAIRAGIAQNRPDPADPLAVLAALGGLDIAAMAQSTPGAIAVNAAVLTGTRIGGTIGMFVAVLGTVIPPFVLLSVLSLCYEAFRQLYPVRLALAGMQAGVAAVILDVAWGLGKNVVRKKDRVDLVLMALVFIAQWFTNLNTAVIILSAAAVGLARGLIRLYGKGENRQ